MSNIRKGELGYIYTNPSTGETAYAADLIVSSVLERAINPQTNEINQLRVLGALDEEGATNTERLVILQLVSEQKIVRAVRKQLLSMKRE